MTPKGKKLYQSITTILFLHIPYEYDFQFLRCIGQTFSFYYDSIMWLNTLMSSHKKKFKITMEIT